MNEKEIINRLYDIYNDLSEYGGTSNRKYSFYPTCSLQIVLSNRLRCSNGNCYTEYKDWTKREVIKAKITLSKAVLIEKGWDELEKTFRHEVAHFANAVLYRKSGHDYNFKLICRAFGGTMNKKMAGDQFSDCSAGSNHFVKTIKRWEYSCPCGHKKQTSKRMSRKKRGSKYYRCGRCRTYTLDTWTEKQLV